MQNALGLSGQYPAHALLTGRERPILTLITEGHSSQAIAEKLFFSITTIETHRRYTTQNLESRGPTDFTR